MGCGYSIQIVKKKKNLSSPILEEVIQSNLRSNQTIHHCNTCNCRIKDGDVSDGRFISSKELAQDSNDNYHKGSLGSKAISSEYSDRSNLIRSQDLIKSQLLTESLPMKKINIQESLKGSLKPRNSNISKLSKTIKSIFSVEGESQKVEKNIDCSERIETKETIDRSLKSHIPFKKSITENQGPQLKLNGIILPYVNDNKLSTGSYSSRKSSGNMNLKSHFAIQHSHLKEKEGRRSSLFKAMNKNGETITPHQMEGCLVKNKLICVERKVQRNATTFHNITPDQTFSNMPQISKKASIYCPQLVFQDSKRNRGDPKSQMLIHKSDAIPRPVLLNHHSPKKRDSIKLGGVFAERRRTNIGLMNARDTLRLRESDPSKTQFLQSSMFSGKSPITKKTHSIRIRVKEEHLSNSSESSISSESKFSSAASLEKYIVDREGSIIDSQDRFPEPPILRKTSSKPSNLALLPFLKKNGPSSQKKSPYKREQMQLTESLDFANMSIYEGSDEHIDKDNEINQYDIIGELGQGAIAKVMKVRDRNTFKVFVSSI